MLIPAHMHIMCARMYDTMFYSLCNFQNKTFVDGLFCAGFQTLYNSVGKACIFHGV